jgi:hypothetical protein
MRRIKRPPVARATSQLNGAVLAVPMCIIPVGDGAMRVIYDVTNADSVRVAGDRLGGTTDAKQTRLLMVHCRDNDLYMNAGARHSCAQLAESSARPFWANLQWVTGRKLIIGVSSSRRLGDRPAGQIVGTFENCPVADSLRAFGRDPEWAEHIS